MLPGTSSFYDRFAVDSESYLPQMKGSKVRWTAAAFEAGSASDPVLLNNHCLRGQPPESFEVADAIAPDINLHSKEGRIPKWMS
jgi:hypothetical protein